MLLLLECRPLVRPPAHQCALTFLYYDLLPIVSLHLILFWEPFTQICMEMNDSRFPWLYNEEKIEFYVLHNGCGYHQNLKSPSHTSRQHQRLRMRLHQVLHCANSDANANVENGSRHILCICVCVTMNTMLKLTLTVNSSYAWTRFVE